MLTSFMQSVLDEELKVHPEKNKEKEEKMATLGQELLEELWKPEQKPTTFWGKIKSVLSDEIDLPQKIFNRMMDFRTKKDLIYEKEKTQQVMTYVTKAFNKGTEILSAACYLFYHNPQAFKKYATTSFDYDEDIRHSTFDEGNVFMPALGIPGGILMIAGQSNQEENRSDDRRLPLLSFSPIKHGYHPCLTQSTYEIEKYQQMLQEPSLCGFKTNPYRFEPFKKLLQHPESNYPSIRHQAIVIAINAMNKRLEREPVKICSHKGHIISQEKQKTL